MGSDAPSPAQEHKTPAAIHNAKEPRLSWWWSRDDERFRGPCADRAEAIMEAWSDDPDSGAFICRAAQREWRTGIFDGPTFAELFDDANDEIGDPDGDPPSSILADDEWEAVARHAARFLRNTIRQKGSLAWAFANRHPSEWVDIPAMWRAAEAAEASVDGSSPQSLAKTEEPS